MPSDLNIKSPKNGAFFVDPAQIQSEFVQIDLLVSEKIVGIFVGT